MATRRETTVEVVEEVRARCSRNGHVLCLFAVDPRLVERSERKDGA